MKAMTDTLRHRGPDDAGAFVEESAGLALGSRRLAVIDLSSHGHQPMASSEDRYVIAYNGEIYNFLEIRGELEDAGERFRGSSDTEVLVNAVQRWGLHEALVRCNGMFALAVWDRHERAGCTWPGTGSARSLSTTAGWETPCSSVRSSRRCVPTTPSSPSSTGTPCPCTSGTTACPPRTRSYRGVSKLAAGTVVTFEERTAPGTLPDPVGYWSLSAVAEDGQRSRWAGPEEAVLDELDSVLRDAVGIRMHADVALGAFLSGGIDSSLVVALMQAQHASKVKTFTIAFDDAAYDEAADARRVAEHLGTEHHELFVTAADALNVIPRLAEVYDEPFADSSQIPTAVLAKLTRSYVTVALSGDGGDELFGGYNRYAWGERFWRRIEPIPPPLRGWVGAALGAVPPVWPTAP